MANTVSVNMALVFNAGGAALQRSSGNQQITINAVDAFYNIQQVGTSDELLASGGVATAGYTMLHNLDNTNYIDVGGVVGNYPIHIESGEWALFPAGVTGIHAKANTAPCQLEYIIASR